MICINLEAVYSEIKEVNESKAMNSIQSIPLDLNDTENSEENGEEQGIVSKPLSSANVSAWGNLKFDRSSSWNQSTVHGTNAGLSRYGSQLKLSNCSQIQNEKSKAYIRKYNFYFKPNRKWW